MTWMPGVAESYTIASVGAPEDYREPPRPIGALPPRPGTEELRAAYLSLLKLSLCDLTSVTTREVRWTGDRRPFTRELTDEDQLSGRALGKDWALDGMTMIGLRRLDDLQACVESVVEDGIEGDLIEAGVWRGGASILVRATLDSLGATDRTLWLADSFEGFPPPDDEGADADRSLEINLRGIDYLAPGLDAVRSYFARFGVEHGLAFVPGFFEDTLAGLRGRRWALMRLDADTHAATKLALEALYPGLARGGYVIVDDYFHPWLPACRVAVDEFRTAHGITTPIDQVDWNGGRWRREDAPVYPADVPEPAEVSDARPSAAAPGPPRSVPRIPTDRELQLDDRLAAATARKVALEAELRALRSHPLARARGWVRARRRLRSG
jgi:O-methyltransferase